MKSGLRIFLVLAVVLSVVALNFVQVKAADKIVVVYGPAAFVRESGKPVEKVVTFTLARPVGEYTMVVQNGEKGARVTSAVIKVNGKIVLGSSDFSENMESTKVVFPLEKNNEISVTLNGKPGSKLTITISGVNELEAKDVAKIFLEASRSKDFNSIREFASNSTICLNDMTMDVDDYCSSLYFSLSAYQLEEPPATMAATMAAAPKESIFRFSCSASYEGTALTFGYVTLINTSEGWKIQLVEYYGGF